MTVTPLKKKPIHVGLSITRQAVEAAVFSPKTMSIEQSASLPIPEGLFDQDADVLQDPGLLKEMIGQLLRTLKPRPTQIYLSIPATLLRLVEMPRMEPAGLYVSLASEAERYKNFDNTEAVVDFCPLENPNLPGNQQQVVFGAVRNDTLHQYLRILKELKLKTAGISLEPLDSLRAMAGTGVLDGMVQQIGMDAHWGVIFVEPTRIRLSVWQADRLIELRETQMQTSEFAFATHDAIVVEDLLEEIRRTSKNVQPSLWLTYEMPPAMNQILAERLGTAFHPVVLGPGLNLSQPLQLATVGTALSSTVQFPFDFDLSAGLGKASGISAPAGSISGGDRESADLNWMIPAGVASLIIGGAVTGGLFALNSITGMQLPDLEKKRDDAKGTVAVLEVRQRELKKKVELDNRLLEMIHNAKIRNHIYVAFTDDLAQKTPKDTVWVQALKVTDVLEMQGKALNHQSVINFARSFDQRPYAKAITLNSIKESKLKSEVVYEFKIGGNVFLNPALLDAPVPTADQPASAADADHKKSGA